MKIIIIVSRIARKIKRFFLLFYYLDFKYILPGIKLLFIQLLYYVTKTIAGTKFAVEHFENIEVVLSFKTMKFSVSAIPSDLGFIFVCFLNKTYESINQFVPKEGYTCLDIGANIGTTVLSWYMNNSSGKMICCEPNPKTFERLQKNINLNNCRNIETLQIAISNINGTIDFYSNDNSSMGKVGPTKSNTKYIVQAYTLDHCAIIKSLACIDLCKIDVEGHEVEILKHAPDTLTKTKRLILEYHSRNNHDEIIKMLMPGFTIIKDSTTPCGLLFAKNKNI